MIGPFLLLVACSYLFAVLGYVLGRIHGYDEGVFHFARLHRVRIEADEAHGDVPSIDPSWGDR
jgi:hypothetical protein